MAPLRPIGAAASRSRLKRAAPASGSGTAPQFRKEDQWPTRTDPTQRQWRGRPHSEPQVATIAQYIKDLSVENPSAPQVFQWQIQPQLDVQFNINVDKVADDVHEVMLKIDVTAKSDNGTHFIVDLSYAGLFGFRNVPGRGAAAVPAGRSAAPAVPVRAPDHRRGGRRTSASRRCCSTRSTSPPPIWRSSRRRSSRVGRPGGGRAASRPDAGDA